MPAILESLRQIRAYRHQLHLDETRQNADVVRAQCQTLAGFFRRAWHVIEPTTKLVWNWHLQVMCLPADSVITTEDGPMPIGEIVETGWRGRVISFNHKAGEWEWRPIARHIKSPASPLYEFKTASGPSIRATGNHPFYVVGRGYVRADQIKPGDRLIALPAVHGSDHARQPLLLAALPLRAPEGRDAASERNDLSAMRGLIPSLSSTYGRGVLLPEVLGSGQGCCRSARVPMLRRTESVGRIAMSQMLGGLSPYRREALVRALREGGLSKPSAVRGNESRARRVLQPCLPRRLYAGSEQSGVCGWGAAGVLCAGISEGEASNTQKGRRRVLSVPLARESGRPPHRPGPKQPRAQKSRRALPSVPRRTASPTACGHIGAREVAVTEIVREARLSGPLYNLEVEGNHTYVADGFLTHNCDHLEAVTRGKLHPRGLVNVPPGSSKSTIISIMWQAWEWGPMGLAGHRFLSTSYEIGNVTRDTRKTRDLILSEWYQELWPMPLKRAGETSFENYARGTREGVAFAAITGKRGDRLTIDDPHSLDGAESETEREKSVRRFIEGGQNRLNDQATSAIIVVMQRLHEGDLTGALIARDLGYWHLMIPMEFEADRQCITPIWKDPRTYDGELMDPQRMPDREVQLLKKDNDYMWCNPADAPVLMADLSLRPIGDVREGDELVGWHTPATKPGLKFAKRTLTRCRVGKVSRSTRAVVKITFESGRSIRCTPDHRWYYQNNGQEYAPAKIGSSLIRVCDPDIRLPRNDDEHRLAGWLAGFFDGEGTVSLVKRKGGFDPSAVVSFTQGSGRNLPLCEKLERALEAFGFDYGVKEREPQNRAGCANHKLRQYYLKKRKLGALPTMQRFLHCIGPSKWRERILDGAYQDRFIVGREKVVSIEHCGEEEVFGLTTTTGNYVVWGLASSNSGQYQQRPAPREGGMFKVDEILKVDSVPAGAKYVRGWDIAGSTRKRSPFTVGAGLAYHPELKLVYIYDVQRLRAQIEVAEKLIIDTARDDGRSVRQSIPQDPGSAGKSQKRHLANRLAANQNDFVFSTETGEKQDRAIPFASLVNAGGVRMVSAHWNGALENEMRNFPSSLFKDQIDALSRAFAELAPYMALDDSDGVGAPLKVGAND